MCVLCQQVYTEQLHLINLFYSNAIHRIHKSDYGDELTVCTRKGFFPTEFDTVEKVSVRILFAAIFSEPETSGGPAWSHGLQACDSISSASL